MATPYVPIPGQVAEAEDLLATLQDVLSYLKSTEPESDKTRQTAQICHKLEQKLKQVQQRIRLHGSPEPLRAPRRPAPPPDDTRRPEAIQALTSELSAQAQPGRLVKGPEVLLTQQILRFCGYALKPTGNFDAATVAAVRTFQTRHKLPVSGRVDEKTRPQLNQQLRMMRAGARTQIQLEFALARLRESWQLQLLPVVEAKLKRLYKQLIVTFSEAAPAKSSNLAKQPDNFDDEPTHLEAIEPVLQRLQSRMGTTGQAHLLSRGPEVGLLQSVLAAAGYSLNINDSFDLQTYSALKAFQARHHLPESGETDPATCAQLNQSLAHDHALAHYRYKLRAALQNFQLQTGTQLRSTELETLNQLLEQTIWLIRHPEAALLPGVDPHQLLVHELGPAGPSSSGQRLSHGSEVLLLQELLLALTPALEPVLTLSESYDTATAKAVRSFQGQNKLPLSGIVDIRTRDALNTALTHLRSQTP